MKRWLLHGLLILLIYPHAVCAETVVVFLSDGKTPVTASNSPPSRGASGLEKEKIQQLAVNYGNMYGVSSELVLAVIKVESNFNRNAVSKAGAQGAMQLMPETGRQLGVRDGLHIADNIEGGVVYLQQMLDRFDSLELALAAYNAGPAAVEKYGGIPPFAETRMYVRRVLAALGHTEGEGKFSFDK